MVIGSHRIVRLTACAAAILGSAAAVAQVPGIEAYRTQPRPGQETLYSRYLPGPALSPFEGRATVLDRARAQLDSGNFRSAKRMLERGVRNWSHPEPHYLSAVAHAGLGEIDDAHRSFAGALSRNADHVGARVGLALTDIQLGRYEEAAAQLAEIEARRAACAGTCPDAEALDRGARLISQVLDQPRHL